MMNGSLAILLAVYQSRYFTDYDVLESITNTWLCTYTSDPFTDCFFPFLCEITLILKRIVSKVTRLMTVTLQDSISSNLQFYCEIFIR